MRAQGTDLHFLDFACFCRDLHAVLVSAQPQYSSTELQIIQRLLDGGPVTSGEQALLDFKVMDRIARRWRASARLGGHGRSKVVRKGGKRCAWRTKCRPQRQARDALNSPDVRGQRRPMRRRTCDWSWCAALLRHARWPRPHGGCWSAGRRNKAGSAPFPAQAMSVQREVQATEYVSVASLWWSLGYLASKAEHRSDFDRGASAL